MAERSKVNCTGLLQRIRWQRRVPAGPARHAGGQHRFAPAQAPGVLVGPGTSSSGRRAPAQRAAVPGPAAPPATAQGGGQGSLTGSQWRHLPSPLAPCRSPPCAVNFVDFASIRFVSNRCWHLPHSPGDPDHGRAEPPPAPACPPTTKSPRPARPAASWPGLLPGRQRGGSSACAAPGDRRQPARDDRPSRPARCASCGHAHPVGPGPRIVTLLPRERRTHHVEARPSERVAPYAGETDRRKVSCPRVRLSSRRVAFASWDRLRYDEQQHARNAPRWTSWAHRPGTGALSPGRRAAHEPLHRAAGCQCPARQPITSLLLNWPRRGCTARPGVQISTPSGAARVLRARPDIDAAALDRRRAAMDKRCPIQRQRPLRRR